MPQDNKDDLQDMTIKIQQGYRAMNANMSFREPQENPPIVGGVRKRLERDFCPTWRTEEELPDAARVFYQEAAELAAIPLKLLLMACLQVERKLEVWSRKKQMEKGSEEIPNDEKGKGKSVAR
jgi:RNA polymerase I-specific transcription initiation factor RRN7